MKECSEGRESGPFKLGWNAVVRINDSPLVLAAKRNWPVVFKTPQIMIIQIPDLSL